MAANVETLGTLQRRVSMSLPVNEIDKQVDERLKKLARNVRMRGFRPGKVPMKLVTQTYGPQVRSEVLGEAVQKTFSDVVKEAKLKVAGYPKIEKKDGSSEKALEFSATFEIYPEVKPGDVSSKSVERPQVAVSDAEVDKTIEILRKQRTRFVEAGRAAQDGDKVTLDFLGTIDARVKHQALDALLDSTPLELPRSLIEMESQELVQRAAADLQARGMKLDQVPLNPAAFEGTAKRRVALGLIISELANAEHLKPKPAEVRALVEQEAQSYESPAEVVKWFYMQPQRLSEMEAAALEANVVKWVLSKAKVVDKDVPFDELMGANT